MGEVDLTKIANHQCLSKHVPLHHAANYWDPGIIGRLFDYGALSSIGMLNILEEQPISKINIYGTTPCLSCADVINEGGTRLKMCTSFFSNTCRSS